jgi:hypothetical protein
MEKTKRPERDGEMWTGFEELELEKQFDEGYSLADLSEMHQRTRKAIVGRLVRLNKIWYHPHLHKYFVVGAEWAKSKDLK